MKEIIKYLDGSFKEIIHMYTLTYVNIINVTLITQNIFIQYGKFRKRCKHEKRNILTQKVIPTARNSTFIYIYTFFILEKCNTVRVFYMNLH